MDELGEGNIDQEESGIVEDKRGKVNTPKIDNDPDNIFDSSKMKKQFSNNFWMISSVILIIIIGLFLFGGSIGIKGSSVSKDLAGERLVAFIASQGVEAELIEINDAGNFYEVVLSINGQQGPVFVTKDGQYFTTALIPLGGEVAQANNNQLSAGNLCGY